MNELAKRDFEQLSITHKGTVPETINGGKVFFDELAEYTNTSDWFRAAFVSAYVKRQQGARTDLGDNSSKLSLTAFANKKIRGLSSRKAVQHYLAAWESTFRDVPIPGQVIELPSDPFPLWGTLQLKNKKDKAVIELSDEVSNKKIKLINGWYQVGNQFLYYGSNLDTEFMVKLPECVFGFADPPYNAGVADWDNDFKWEQDYLQDVARVVAVTPGGWNAYNFYRETNMSYMWEMCCWIKNGMTHGRCGYANFIKASIFGKESIKIPQDFFSITIKTSNTEDTKHKGRKPYEFMQHLIELFSNEGDNIIDCFAGSGTTLLMSEKLNRISYNAEIREDYCKEIIGRAISEGMDYGRI